VRVETVDVSFEFQGRVADRVGIYSDRFGLPRGRTILLVHGFNVSGAKAVRKLNAFRRYLADAFPPLADETFTSHWPGRHALAGAAYPFVIKSAKLTAATFALALERWHAEPGKRELVIVAHSLGCRMVLEALKLVDPSVDLHKLTVVLMAAAVPNEMLAPGKALAGALARPARLYMLHSRRDAVLAGVFRVGQTLAREGVLPTAAGLNGCRVSPHVVNRDMSPHGHADYWDDASTAVDLCRLVGVPVSGTAFATRRTLSSRLPLGQAAISPRLPLS
jgi:hypothetical protein